MELSWVVVCFMPSEPRIHAFFFFLCSRFESVLSVSVALSTMNFNNDSEIRVDDVNWRESGSFFQSFAAKSKPGKKTFLLAQHLNCIRERKSEERKKKRNMFVFKIGWNRVRAHKRKRKLYYQDLKVFRPNEFTSYLVSRYCLKSRR